MLPDLLYTIHASSPYWWLAVAMAEQNRLLIFSHFQGFTWVTLICNTLSHSDSWFCNVISSGHLILFRKLLLFPWSRDGVFGIATHYRLEGPGIESWWGWDFPHLSRLAPRPTQPPEQWVPDLSRGKGGRSPLFSLRDLHGL